MNKPIAEILTPKPASRLRIYAYTIDDAAHQGLLKVGQTTRDVRQRVAEQLKTAAIANYTIVLDEAAERDDGSVFTDHEVRAALPIALADLRAKGMTVVDNPDKSKFVAALAPVNAEFEKQFGKATLDKIRDVK